MEGTTLSLENVKELLVYAESKNCALLKEVAIDFLVIKRDEVIGKISFNDAPGNLMNDLLVVMLREPNRPRTNLMSCALVNCVVWFMKGDLDGDGSREMLIAAFKESP